MLALGALSRRRRGWPGANARGAALSMAAQVGTHGWRRCIPFPADTGTPLVPLQPCAPCAFTPHLVPPVVRVLAREEELGDGARGLGQARQRAHQPAVPDLALADVARLDAACVGVGGCQDGWARDWTSSQSGRTWARRKWMRRDSTRGTRSSANTGMHACARRRRVLPGQHLATTHVRAMHSA